MRKPHGGPTLTEEASQKIEQSLPAIVFQIADTIQQYGGKAYLNGGYVRDMVYSVLHGTPGQPKDIDIEVHRINEDTLIEILSSFGHAKKHGKSFGAIILHHEGQQYDFNLARKEKKTGEGHQGFSITTEQDISLREAAKRRDLTINALLFDILGNTSNKIIDPFRGINDLQTQTLRATSERFSEDPLRVLRAMQFISRFDLTPDPTTIEMVQKIKGEYTTLSKERISTERQKLLLQGKYPSKGLEFLRESTWIDHYPELKDMIGIEQNPQWHPEGDVRKHSLHVADAMTQICDREEIENRDRMILILAAICHDMGKATTTFLNDTQTRVSPLHEEEGIKPTASFLKKILTGVKKPQKIIDEVTELVKLHMFHKDINTDDIGKSLRKFISTKISKTTFEKLILLVEADYRGRPQSNDIWVDDKGEKIQYMKGNFPKIETLKETYRSMPPRIKEIISGDDLIARGIQDPSKCKKKYYHQKERVFSIVFQKLEEKRINGFIKNKEDCQKVFIETFIEPYITHKDLRGLGIQPGKAYKEIFDTVKKGVCEGRIKSKEEAMNVARTVSLAS